MKRPRPLFAFATAALAAASLAAPSASALTAEEAALEAAIPSADNLEALKGTIASDPENLDNYFSYAMLAKRFEKYDRAAWALENMLTKNPDLQRVKLELGLIYIELEQFEQARNLFNEVLTSSPPKAVQDNISNILAALSKRDQRHHLKFSITAGVNSDSNANSAPSSGNVTVVDTTIPLGAGSGANEDVHAYSAMSLNHTYDIDVSRKRPSWRWKTSALAYHTEQDTLDDLNLQLYSVKSGPEVTFSDIPVQAHLAVGYQHIKLDHESYLRSPRVEGNIDILAEPDLIFNYNYVWEYRSYLNSATNTTFVNRTGGANQHKFGVKHILSPQDILGYAVVLRNETARELYLANKQVGFNVDYTRALSELASITLAAGYKSSKYVIPDLLISTRDRVDNEYSAGVNANYRLKTNQYGDFILGAGYQYRDVQSTIQNYEYDNHRFSLSATKELEY